MHIPETNHLESHCAACWENNVGFAAAENISFHVKITLLLNKFFQLSVTFGFIIRIIIWIWTSASTGDTFKDAYFNSNIIYVESCLCSPAECQLFILWALFWSPPAGSRRLAHQHVCLPSKIITCFNNNCSLTDTFTMFVKQQSRNSVCQLCWTIEQLFLHFNTDLSFLIFIYYLFKFSF